MRISRVFAVLCLLFAGIAASAQAPLGYVTVNGSHLADSTGTLIANATISFAPVNNSGIAISYRASGSGQVVQSPVTALVTSGSFSIVLADTALTSPANVCYLVTITDNVSGSSLLGPGYNCVQPAGSGTAVTGSSAWCSAAGTSGGVCNFDSYTPNLSALSVVTVGATGPAGSTPTLSGVNVTTGSTLGGTWSGCPSACVLNLVITAGTSYAGPWAASTAYTAGQIVLQAGALYIAPPGGVAAAGTFSAGSWNVFPSSGGGGTVNTTTALGSPAIYTGSTAVGTTLQNIAVVGLGDSRMAGTNTVCVNAPHAGAFPVSTCGSNGYQDFISVLIRQSNFANRVVTSYNDGVPGTTCSQMVTNFGSGNIVNYAPGGSSAPTAAQTYAFISMGYNDATTGGETLAQYQSCMGGFLNTLTTDGFSPVLWTSYWSPTATVQQQATLDQYNAWIRSLKNVTLNGQLIRVFDADQLVGRQTAGWQYATINNPYVQLYPFSGASVSGGVLSFTTTVSASYTSQLSTNPIVECGGFQTAVGLNYARATYASGAGTTALTFTLAAPIANVTTSDTGVCWSINSAGSIHLGPDGVKMLATAANDEFGLSGIGTRSTPIPGQEYFSPAGGTVIVQGGLCVVNTVSLTPVAACPAAAVGHLGSNAVPANLYPSVGGFYAGQGGVDFGYNGSNNSFINSTPTGINIHGALYTGPSGAIGAAYPTGFSSGTGYAIGDTGTLAAGGSGLSWTVSGIVVGGACQTYGTTANIGTGPACLLTVTAGGSGYTAGTSQATTALTGSGTGMTVNTAYSSSQAGSWQGAGFVLNGGSLRVSGLGVPAYANDAGTNSGEIATANGGAVLTATIVSGGSGYVTGDTVTLAGGTGGSGTATATVTAASGVATALTIVNGGYNYVVDAQTRSTTGGSGTGLTWTPHTTSTLGGRIRFGNSYTIADNGVTGMTITPSGPLSVTYPVQASQFIPTGSTQPTMVAGAGAGTSPTCTSLTGWNAAGVVTCTTGTSPTASATLATITLSGTLTTAFRSCQLTPRNAATVGAPVYTTLPSTSSWAIGVGATALTASTAYSWSYLCE